jgi:hypothetical protein
VRYWWVNQKQTHRQEIGGGYLWSPKRRANDTRNQFYENMKVVAPGDLVFSYWEMAIRAYGLVRSYGYDAPKPDEFGGAGRHWSQVGYRVDVSYEKLVRPFAPRDAWEPIRSLLPAKYSPLNQANGRGLQSVYLAELPPELGELLRGFIFTHDNPLPALDERALLIASAEEPEREHSAAIKSGFSSFIAQRSFAARSRPSDRGGSTRRGQRVLAARRTSVPRRRRIFLHTIATFLIDEFRACPAPHVAVFGPVVRG